MIIVFQQANCQTTQEQLEGSWLGTLNAGGVQLRLVFNISMDEDSELKATIIGKWNQNNRSFDLNLEKQKEEFVLIRPQEPDPPYPYVEEEVVFENEDQGFSLVGTLTIPEGKGPFPAVILISGSGSQNRDEE